MKQQVNPTNKNQTPILGNRSYDLLKWVTQIFLPAMGTLYFTLSGIWGLPKGQEVIGTITAVTLCLGILINISHAQYKNSEIRFDGSVDVYPDEDRGELHMDEETLYNKDEITLKVNRARKTSKRK